MGHIVHASLLSHPIERVWSALADLEGVYRLHPGIASAHLVEGSARAGVGALRRCDFSDGRHLIERVDRWEPCERLVLSMESGDMPLRSARTTISVRKLHSRATATAFELEYVVGGGLLGRVLDLLLLKRRFSAMVTEILDGLEAHLATTRPESTRDPRFGPSPA